MGLYREEATDAPFLIISLVFNPLIGLLRHPRPSTRVLQNMSARAVPATDSYEQIKEALKSDLPGVRIHRTLFWRYLAIWQNPCTSPC